MRNAVAVLAVLGLAYGGLYADLSWDATTLADALGSQNSSLLSTPQAHYDAEVIAKMIEQRAGPLGLQLDDLRVHVGSTTAVKLGGVEHRPNTVEFEFTARRKNFLGTLMHRRAKGTVMVQVNQGPRDWPGP